MLDENVIRDYYDERIQEPKNLTNESLEAESGNFRKIGPKERNEENRDYYDQKRIEKSKSTAHEMFISALRILFRIGVGLLAIWVWHLVWPVSWHYLGDAQLDVIENIPIAVGSCGFVAKYVQKQLSNWKISIEMAGEFLGWFSFSQLSRLGSAFF